MSFDLFIVAIGAGIVCLASILQGIVAAIELAKGLSLKKWSVIMLICIVVASFSGYESYVASTTSTPKIPSQPSSLIQFLDGSHNVSPEFSDGTKCQVTPNNLHIMKDSNKPNIQFGAYCFFPLPNYYLNSAYEASVKRSKEEMVGITLQTSLHNIYSFQIMPNRYLFHRDSEGDKEIRGGSFPDALSATLKVMICNHTIFFYIDKGLVFKDAITSLDGDIEQISMVGILGLNAPQGLPFGTVDVSAQNVKMWKLQPEECPT